MESPEAILATAVEAARAGAEVLRHHFRSAGLEIAAKGQNDPVTAADRESEQVIVEAIRRRFPDHAFLAEEGGAHGGTHELEWVIDPLDGTNNFLQGHPTWCVSVACRQRGEPLAGVVLDPQGGNLFTALRGGGAYWNDRPMRVSRRPGLAGSFLATGYPFRAHAALDLYLRAFRDIFLQARGIRRCGAAALDLAFTAAGVYDGFFEFRLSPWDIAAGLLLVREAGGRFTDLDGGDSYFVGGNVVAGGEGVWRELRQAMARHADEATLDRLDPAGAAVC
ncbi:MAG TPA: inositol monophosphatase family protein [Thermoanaerobaculia bacterium]|nr:inositol monophosphatase family protein [Thermoanaerobaculia bacterium]